MNSKEFVNKLIDFAKEQINYYENKIVEDEKYPSLQKCHKEELISVQEGLNHFLKIKQDLDKLEDLEEELGIDLITLFKAKKEGIYYKAINNNIYYISKNCLCLEFNFKWELWVENHSILEGLLINLKDYKKTWALCREDLENE